MVLNMTIIKKMILNTVLTTFILELIIHSILIKTCDSYYIALNIPINLNLQMICYL